MEGTLGLPRGVPRGYPKGYWGDLGGLLLEFEVGGLTRTQLGFDWDSTQILRAPPQETQDPLENKNEETEIKGS